MAAAHSGKQLQGRDLLEGAGNPVTFSSVLKHSLLEAREKLMQLTRLGSLESYKIHQRSPVQNKQKQQLGTGHSRGSAGSIIVCWKLCELSFMLGWQLPLSPMLQEEDRDDSLTETR